MLFMSSVTPCKALRASSTTVLMRISISVMATGKKKRRGVSDLKHPAEISQDSTRFYRSSVMRQGNIVYSHPLKTFSVMATGEKKGGVSQLRYPALLQE